MIKTHIAQAPPTATPLPNATVTFDPWVPIWIALASGLTALITTFLPQLIKERSDARIKEDQQESNAEMSRNQARTNADISGALTESNIRKQKEEAVIDINSTLSNTVSALARDAIDSAKDNTKQVLSMLAESMEGQKHSIEAAMLHQKATQSIAEANSMLANAMTVLSLAVSKNGQDHEKTHLFNVKSLESVNQSQESLRDDLAGSMAVIVAKFEVIIQKQHEIDESISQGRKDILSAIASLPT